MDTGLQSPIAPGRKSNALWAVAFAVVLVVLTIALSGVYVFRRATELPGRGVDKVAGALATVGEAFKRGTISTSFISYATTITGSSYFQFASLHQMEIFERKDERTSFWVPLPDVVVEARAPVEYTYFLDLKGAWKIAARDHSVYVLTPPIRFNTPAVDASSIEYVVRKGSVLRRETPVIEALKQSITTETARRADENISLVREEGRKQVSAFIKAWLGHQFADGTECMVEVYFPDEPLPPGLTAAGGAHE